METTFIPEVSITKHGKTCFGKVTTLVNSSKSLLDKKGDAGTNRETAIHGCFMCDWFCLSSQWVHTAWEEVVLSFWVPALFKPFKSTLKAELTGKRWFTKAGMESYSLNGTLCQSFDWLKIVNLQTAAVFVKINYSLTDITLKLV